MNRRSGTDFVYGRDLVKKMMIVMVALCAASLLVPEGTLARTLLVCFSSAMFITAIVCIVRFCRCPHCGKVIFFGMLAIEKCPRCRYNLITGGKSKKRK